MPARRSTTISANARSNAPCCTVKMLLFYSARCTAPKCGDLFMSLIHTCELNEANPFDYLTELQRHARLNSEANRPSEWMPWNYREGRWRRKVATRVPPRNMMNPAWPERMRLSRAMQKRRSKMAGKRASKKAKTRRVFGPATENRRECSAHALYSRVSTNDQHTLDAEPKYARVCRPARLEHRDASSRGGLRSGATRGSRKTARCCAPLGDRYRVGLAAGSLGQVGDGPWRRFRNWSISVSVSSH